MPKPNGTAQLFTTYPATPVDALLSDLHSEYEAGTLTEDYWRERITAFWKEVYFDE